ncbi:MAG: hypothetical protein ACMG6E_00575 [Candidatus Roizmanbacteria bacterium]
MRKLFIILSSAFLTTLFVQNVSAQQSVPLQVAPVRQQVEVKPGENKDLTIQFYNFSKEPIRGSIHITDFIVKSNGSPIFIEDASLSNAKYSALSWTTTPYSLVTLPAEDKLLVPIHLKVPTDAHPGGRYLAVYLESSAGDPALKKSSLSPNQAGSSVTPRIVGLIYIRVEGPIAEKASLLRFFAPSFQEYGPIEVTSSIFNNGDYHITPQGIVSAQNMFGSSVAQILLEEKNIFPESSSDFKTMIGQKWMIGRYKISLATSYGEQGQALARSIYVWVFPWKIALLIVLGIILMILLLKYISGTYKVRQKNLEEKIDNEKEQIELLKEELRKRE